MLAVAFALLIAPAALAEPSAAPTGVAPTWSPLSSSLAEVSTTARAAARPYVTRLSLTAAKPGARLTITGRGFGARRGKGSVLFGAYKSTKYVRWSATQDHLQGARDPRRASSRSRCAPPRARATASASR